MAKRKERRANHRSESSETTGADKPAGSSTKPDRRLTGIATAAAATVLVVFVIPTISAMLYRISHASRSDTADLPYVYRRGLVAEKIDYNQVIREHTMTSANSSRRNFRNPVLAYQFQEFKGYEMAKKFSDCVRIVCGFSSCSGNSLLLLVCGFSSYCFSCSLCFNTDYYFYMEVDGTMNSLLPFRKSIHFRGGRGSHGQGQQNNGAKGESVVVKVPPGTVVRESNGDVLFELLYPGQRALLLPGGRGGRGNASFKTGTNKVPKIEENGEEGLEL